MGSARSVERLDTRILKKAYSSLILSLTGLVLSMINWVGITINMYGFMDLHDVVVNAMIYMESPIMASLLGLSIAQLPAVFVLNRLGNRLPMALGLIVNGISMGMVTTGDYYSALASRFLSGVGLGLYMLPSLSYIMGWWSNRGLMRWVQLVYLTSFFASMAVSAAISSILPRWIVQYLGVTSIILSLLVLVLGRDALVIRRISVVAVMNNPDIILLSMSFSTVWGTFLGLMGEVSRDVWLTVSLTSATLASLLAYRFRRISMKRRLLATLLGLIYGASLTSLSVGASWGSLAIIGVLFAINYLSLASIINELVSPLLVVQTMGYLLALSSSLAPIFLYLDGYLFDTLGSLRWVILGLIVMLSSLLYLRVHITPYFSDTSQT